MKEIRNLEPQTKFIGIGGKYMMENGFEMKNNYADVEKFVDKPFIPLKNFLLIHLE